MILSTLLDPSDNLNNLSASNLYVFEEEGRGVEVANHHRVILNNDVGSRVRGRMRVNC